MKLCRLCAQPMRPIPGRYGPTWYCGCHKPQALRHNPKIQHDPIDRLILDLAAD